MNNKLTLKESIKLFRNNIKVAFNAIGEIEYRIFETYLKERKNVGIISVGVLPLALMNSSILIMYIIMCASVGLTYTISALVASHYRKKWNTCDKNDILKNILLERDNYLLISENIKTRSNRKPFGDGLNLITYNHDNSVDKKDNNQEERIFSLDDDVYIKKDTFQLFVEIKYSNIDENIKEYLIEKIIKIDPKYNHTSVTKSTYLKKIEHIRGMFNLYQNSYKNNFKYNVKTRKRTQ